MKKVYRLNKLGCANCANQMQEAIQALDGVKSAKVNFMLAKMTLEADSAEDLPAKDELQKIISSIEPYCTIQ